MSVLDRRWRFQSRRGRVVDFRRAEQERRIFDEAALHEWALTHPSGVDMVIRACDYFAPETTQARVEALRRQAHHAVDRAFDAAICRHVAEVSGWSP